MPYNRNLDPTARGYCESLYRSHDKQKKRQVPLHRSGYENSYRTEFYDLPAVAVTCSNGRHTTSDYSRGVKEEHVKEPLKSAIENLGTIGHHRIDGSCAVATMS